MRKLVWTIMLLATAAFSAQAGGYRHGYYGGHGWHHGSSVSFVFGGGYPFYAPYYSYPYPSYAYSSYAYPSYGYSRPNYAVGGTLLGALTGGLIGNSINHQGWEGAGIGAAAGLVLGGLAEHAARNRERAYYSSSAISSAAPAYSSTQPAVNNSATVPNAPVAPPAPVVQAAPATSATPMSGANSLFGR